MFWHASKLGLQDIVSKREGTHRSGRLVDYANLGPKRRRRDLLYRTQRPSDRDRHKFFDSSRNDRAPGAYRLFTLILLREDSLAGLPRLHLDPNVTIEFRRATLYIRRAPRGIHAALRLSTELHPDFKAEQHIRS